MRVGEMWVGRLGSEEVLWRVLRVTKKRAQVRAQLEYGTCTAWIWLARIPNENWYPAPAGFPSDGETA